MQAGEILPQILDSLPLGVYVVNAQGQPYYANQASLALLGQSIIPNAKSEDLPNLYQLYICGTKTLYPADELPVMRALRGETGCLMNIEIHRPDKTVPLQVWYKPIYDQNHRVAYGVATFQDVSEELVSLAEKEQLKKTELERRHHPS